MMRIIIMIIKKMKIILIINKIYVKKQYYLKIYKYINKILIYFIKKKNKLILINFFKIIFFF